MTAELLQQPARRPAVFVLGTVTAFPRANLGLHCSPLLPPGPRFPGSTGTRSPSSSPSACLLSPPRRSDLGQATPPTLQISVCGDRSRILAESFPPPHPSDQLGRHSPPPLPLDQPCICRRFLRFAVFPLSDWSPFHTPPLIANSPVVSGLEVCIGAPPLLPVALSSSSARVLHASPTHCPPLLVRMVPLGAAASPWGMCVVGVVF